MIVSINQIQNGIVRFVENEIAKKAVNWDKFKINFIIPKIPKAVAEMLTQCQDNILFKDYFNEDGNIKLDEVYNNAKIAIQKSGQFTFSDLIFKESDIDLMYEYIKSIN